jgi:uracil phosphoribosyltransferase
VKGIYTFLRDVKSNRQDFIFFVDRLATFLIEKAMEHLPYRPKTITTPVDVDCTGKELDVKVRQFTEGIDSLIFNSRLRTSAASQSYARTS